MITTLAMLAVATLALCMLNVSANFHSSVLAHLQVAQTTHAGILHYLRHAVCLRGSWRLVGVWRRAGPPSRAPPMPLLLVRAMAMLAVMERHPALGMSLLIGFHALLRTAELLVFRRGQFYQYHAGNIIVAIGRTKSGKRRGRKSLP